MLMIPISYFSPSALKLFWNADSLTFKIKKNTYLGPGGTVNAYHDY